MESDSDEVSRDTMFQFLHDHKVYLSNQEVNNFMRVIDDVDK